MFDHALHFCFDNRAIVAQYSLHTAQAWFRELYVRQSVLILAGIFDLVLVFILRRKCLVLVTF